MSVCCEWFEPHDGFEVIDGPAGFADDNGSRVDPGNVGLILHNGGGAAVIEGSRSDLRAMLTATLAKLDESDSRCVTCRAPEHDRCGHNLSCPCCRATDCTARGHR